MLVLSNSEAQVVGVGQALTFDTTILRAGCGECHRKNAGSVKMCKKGVYALSFSGNISNPNSATGMSVTLSTGGDLLPETNMLFVPPATGVPGNISTTTRVKNLCCDYDRVSVVNTGTTSITVAANSCFVIEEVCDHGCC